MVETELRSGAIVHKTRQRPPTNVTVPVSQGYKPDGTVEGASFGGGTILSSSFKEDIMYTTKPRKQRNLSNRCVHTKEAYGYGEYPLVFRKVNSLVPGFAGYYTNYYNGHLHAASAHGQALAAALATIPGNTGSAVLGVNGQDWMNSFWAKSKPDLTTVSLPNFLFELGELKNLGHVWDRKKSLSKNLAGGVLHKQYAVTPLIGDVVGILDAVVNLKAKLDAFEAQCMQPQLVRGSVYSDDYSGSGTFNYQGDSHQPCSWRVTANRRVTAHLRFVPRPIRALNDVDKYLRAYLQGLGVELNPKIIWDAIPFSFVVDKFVDLGKFLDQFKHQSLELPVELLDGCLQYKETISVESRLRLDVNSTISTANSWPGVASSFQRFERMPLLPDYEALRAPDVHWPSLKQAEVLFALAVANGVGQKSRPSASDTRWLTDKLAFVPKSTGLIY